jgi:hypothetical protein
MPHQHIENSQSDYLTLLCTCRVRCLSDTLLKIGETKLSILIYLHKFIEITPINPLYWLKIGFIWINMQIRKI